MCRLGGGVVRSPTLSESRRELSLFSSPTPIAVGDGVTSSSAIFIRALKLAARSSGVCL